MTEPVWQPPGMPPAPEPPPPKNRHQLRWVLLSIAGGLALIIGLAVAFAALTNHAKISTATPSPAPAAPSTPPEQQRFISDVRSQYDVGPEVIDEDIVTVGSQICQGARSGSDRATLDKLPEQNGFSISGNGSDSLVNLAIRDMCPGSAPVPTWHTLAHYSGSGQWKGPTFKVLGDNPVLKVIYHYRNNSDGFGATNFIADLVSRDDYLNIANDIAISGGKTTRVYPDVSFGGSTHYHVEIQAVGSWTVTIRQRY
jgi:hypothetical protein